MNDLQPMTRVALLVAIKQQMDALLDEHEEEIWRAYEDNYQRYLEKLSERKSDKKAPDFKFAIPLKAQITRHAPGARTVSVAFAVKMKREGQLDQEVVSGGDMFATPDLRSAKHKELDSRLADVVGPEVVDEVTRQVNAGALDSKDCKVTATATGTQRRGRTQSVQNAPPI